MCGPWVDKALDIRNATGAEVQWGCDTINIGIALQKRHWISLKRPGQAKPLVFDGPSLNQAAWALCQSEFPDPLDRPELTEAS